MDFLLECIGFPPGTDFERLEERLLRQGETAPLVQATGTHLRLAMAGGVELRLDREPDSELSVIWPHFNSTRRLRVEYRGMVPAPGTPYDVVLHGLANPPIPGDPWCEVEGHDYALSTHLTGARLLPKKLAHGHVLALSVAGFGIDVSYCGPNAGVRDRNILEEPCGALLVPTIGSDAPAGCMDLSLRIRSIRRLENPWTQERILILEVDAPGRPLELFVSPWQFEFGELEEPRPGYRIEGSFLFSGRLAGGLPRRQN
jgi:hypothetical protein